MMKEWRESLSPYIFILPASVLMGAFLYLPLLQSIGYSFFELDGFTPESFIGLGNYAALFQDPIFWNSIGLTLQWALMSAFIPPFVGLILAILLEYRTKNRVFSAASRLILFLPQMMSMVALGLLWSLIYNPLIGLISSLFNSLGITSTTDPINLLGDTRTAIYAAFAPAVWFNAGFSMIVFSAAIQGVPREIIESAITDGANKLQQIVFITIPCILRTMMLLIMVNMISGFKAFDILHVLTNGGPGLATNITSLYMYRQAFFAFKFDYAATMAVVLFFLTVVFVIVVGNITDRIFRRFGH